MEEATGTFGDLPIGAKYRAPWTYEVKEKISHTQARGLATGAIYNCHPNKPVRQDWYIEQEAKQAAHNVETENQYPGKED